MRLLFNLGLLCLGIGACASALAGVIHALNFLLPGYDGSGRKRRRLAALLISTSWFGCLGFIAYYVGTVVKSRFLTSGWLIVPWLAVTCVAAVLSALSAWQSRSQA